jgi:hypothetical protein
MGSSLWQAAMPLGAAAGVRHIAVAALKPSDK